MEKMKCNNMNIATIAVVPAIILILNHIAIIASTNVQTGI